jgi:hypothetical protein
MTFEVFDEQQEPGELLVDSSKEEHKVVLHLKTCEVIKGNIDHGKDDLAAFFTSISGDALGAIPVRIQGAKEPKPIEVREVKAIFVVKSFRGDAKRNGLRFYSHGPAVGSIWVEIQFKDNEIVEGLVENSLQHLMGNGFLLRPSDPGSNNIYIYVNKVAIASYRVLGVRALR